MVREVSRRGCQEDLETKREVIIDTEWNGLDTPDRLWCIVCRDILTNEVFVFENNNLDDFKTFSKSVSLWVGHNFIQFDYPNLVRLGFGDCFDVRDILDTLTISRLVSYKIEGGHSLEAWGKRLRLPESKIQISDWSLYTPEIRERCITDTVINLETYKYLLKYILMDSFKEAIRLELDTEFLCLKLRLTGFPFDKDKALRLKEELSRRLQEIDNQLISSFPSTVKVLKEFTPKRTLKGTLNSKDFRWLPKGSDISFFKEGTEYSLISLSPFDPGSLKQIIERLNDAGWKPTEKTKGHLEATTRRRGRGSEPSDPDRLEHFSEYGWKLSEENLRTLPDTAPEAAQRLVERLLVASRVSDLEEWINLCTPVYGASRGYRIHGTFSGIGTWTHRKSTSKPNMQNIPVAKHSDQETEIEKLSNRINDEMRDCWVAERGKRLVGVDADGIQMRVFAHYVNDPRLISALVRGDKREKTDIHSLHQNLLGTACLSRDDAKTFIYAWLLGAGVAKVSEILKCSLGEAKEAIDNFITGYPGLAELKRTRIPADAARGYFEGLDKRLVVCYDEHRVLAGMLQNGESVIMKRACRDWNKILMKEKIPYEFVNDVHDEWQVMIPDNQDIAKFVTDIMVESLVQQGKELEMLCPLAGTAKIQKDGFIGGYSWRDTH